MLFVQSVDRRDNATLKNIAHCDRISLEKDNQGQFCIKLYVSSGQQGAITIKYLCKDAALKDFETLKKSLKEHRFLWECSEEGQIVD